MRNMNALAGFFGNLRGNVQSNLENTMPLSVFSLKSSAEKVKALSTGTSSLKIRTSQLSLNIPSNESDENINYGQSLSFMNCIGVCVPFLVYHVRVSNAFLKRFSLELDMCYVKEHNEKHILYEAMHLPCNWNVTPKAGGYTLNIANAMQWILLRPKSVVVLGARAMDDDALTFLTSSRNMELYFRMEERKSATTCIMAVFHFKSRFCEVLFVGPFSAAFSLAFVDRPSITKLLERANVLFTSDFCIYVMNRAIRKLAYYSHSRFKLLCVHIQHAELLTEDKASVKEIFSYVDLIFVTPKSARQFMKIFHIQETKACCEGMKDRPRSISQWVRTLSHKTCTVVLTDGLNSAHVHTGLETCTTKRYTTAFVRNSKEDYFGVHSAFVGGFMAMMIQGHHIEASVHCGFFCASMVAKQPGMTLPANRKDIVLPLYRLLERLAVDINCDPQERMKKTRPSDMPFTIFQSPWTEKDTQVLQEDLYGTSSDMHQSPVGHCESSHYAESEVILSHPLGS